jgi:Electron transfer DM13
MTFKASAWLSRHKRLLIAVSIPILVALWWAFRPEKLWINQTVNEPAPFDTSGDPEPIFTGQFDGKAGGRVTVFKKPSGEEYLRLSDLTVPGDADAHVELAKSGEVSQAQDAGKAGLDSIDLGPLKTNQDDQNYDLPAAADLTKYNAVVIYNKRTSAILGSAKLEAF